MASADKVQYEQQFIVNDDGTVYGREGTKFIKLDLDFVDSHKPVLYPLPSEFFEKNNHQKPEILLPIVTNWNTLKFQIKSQILTSQYVPEQVNAFLGHVLSTIKERLHKDWSSFGVTIGKKGEEVNPLSVYTLKTENITELSESGTIIESDINLAAVLLANYRVGLAMKNSKAAYILQVQKKISDTFAKQPINNKMSIVSATKGAQTLSRNNVFCKLVAAFDLFMVKFPKNFSASIRVATLPSRFRDCAAYESLKSLESLTGKEVSYLKRFCWNDEIAQNIDRVMKEDEELDSKDSYSAYLKDMGLCYRSPYSTNANRYLYNWVHSIGCFLNSDRSKQAIELGPEGLLASINHAMIFVFFSGLGQKEALDNYEGDKPQSMEPEDIAAWFKSINCRIPHPIIFYWRNFFANETPKAGTILKKVKQIIDFMPLI